MKIKTYLLITRTVRREFCPCVNLPEPGARISISGVYHGDESAMASSLEHERSHASPDAEDGRTECLVEMVVDLPAGRDFDAEVYATATPNHCEVEILGQLLLPGFNSWLERQWWFEEA
jgi:hypothetical protein